MAPLGAVPWHWVGQRVNGVLGLALLRRAGDVHRSRVLSPSPTGSVGNITCSPGTLRCPTKSPRCFFSCGFPALLLGGGQAAERAVLCLQRGDRCCSHPLSLVSCTCRQHTSGKCLARASFPHSFVIFQAQMLRFHFRRGFPCPARGFSCEVRSDGV